MTGIENALAQAVEIEIGGQWSMPTAWIDRAGTRTDLYQEHGGAGSSCLAYSSLYVGTGASTIAEPRNDRHVQGPVRLPVAARIEPVPGRVARGSRNGGRDAEVRERGLGFEAADVLAGGDQ